MGASMLHPEIFNMSAKINQNEKAVETNIDFLCLLCNKNQLKLTNFDEFGDDFIQLQTFFHFEPIIYECFFLFVSGTAARSVRPLTLAHDNNIEHPEMRYNLPKNEQ